MIVASLSQSGGRGGLGGSSTRSLFNIGGSRRIPCGGGCQTGGSGSLSGRHAFPHLHQSFGGDMHYGIPRSHTERRNYGGSCWHGHVHGVGVNELLLKPLCVGVDPEWQNIRVREREQMKSLNNQFACFIDQVRCLEQKNKVLVTKWSFLQQQALPARRDLKPLFENAISSLRKQLGFLLGEKEQMEAQLGHMQQSVEEMKRKYEEEINQRMAMENDFVLLKRDVDGAFMNKVHLETKVESMKQEAAFLRCAHDEEIALLEEQIQSGTAISVQMDNTRDLDMNAIIHGVELWYQSIAHRSKEEANAFYRNTCQELQNQKSQMSDALKMSKCEMAEASRAVQRLQYEVDRGKKQVACLQSALCDAEKRGDCALKDAQERLEELHGALHEAKDQLAALLWGFRELLNHKLALDIEIATYKSLLEGEENRYCSRTSY
ncbi:keratin, type II cytoskeletal 6C-like [Varanus komodoensis]|uniref:keratin, type II cytoskeletal 6C-like n=1 Tax=Varanus komodoensis TaxID=61221 RepID=UPI001CF7C4EA|nr:keratin, type II cytoskeletal 6C-like [Varanus komodoensis]